MFKQHKDAIEALTYVTECTLASMAQLAMRKKPSKREVVRLATIATYGLLHGNPDIGTRGDEVLRGVEQWTELNILRSAVRYANEVHKQHNPGSEWEAEVEY